jgi:hypothetical protein
MTNFQHYGADTTDIYEKTENKSIYYLHFFVMHSFSHVGFHSPALSALVRFFLN